MPFEEIHFDNPYDRPVLIDDRPLLDGLNDEIIKKVKDNKKEMDAKECKYVPIDFGDLSCEQYIKFQHYPIALYGNFYWHKTWLGQQLADGEWLGEITVDDRGVKYIYIKNSDTKYYLVPCPYSVDKNLDIDFSYNFTPKLPERFECRIYINDQGYLVYEEQGKFISYLSFVYPLEDKNHVENPKVGTTGTTGSNSNAETNVNIGTVGGLQQRGQKGQQKQLGIGQNWYMFLIPILLWFYKKKND